MNGSILIIARDNLHLTKKAVASALAQTVPCDVMVIDNCSSDGTIWWLHTKPVVMITTIKQKSLAACWNYGIKAFWKAGENRILVLNNDVEIGPSFYCDLCANGGPFVTGVSVNSKDQIGSSWNINNERPHPDFSAFMISKQVTDKIGWFNEDYFPAYCEDSDYHVRMHRAGIKAVCVDLPFYHAAAQTLKQAGEGEQARIRRGADANRERFRKTYGCLPGSEDYEALFTPHL